MQSAVEPVLESNPMAHRKALLLAFEKSGYLRQFLALGIDIGVFVFGVSLVLMDSALWVKLIGTTLIVIQADFTDLLFDIKFLKGLNRGTLLRNYWLLISRLGEPDAATKAALVKHLSPFFPLNDPGQNRDLCEILVVLGDESIVAKAAHYVNDARMFVHSGTSNATAKLRLAEAISGFSRE